MHVPQNIFLLDSTIKDNIVFGFDGLDVSHAEVNEVPDAEIRISLIVCQINMKLGEDGTLFIWRSKAKDRYNKTLFRKRDFNLRQSDKYIKYYNRKKY